jgi:hypothetical protein
VDAERLHRPGDDIRAVVAGRGEDAKADRVHADDGLGPRRAGGLRDLAAPVSIVPR